MLIATLIISVISLLLSMASIIWLLAKQFSSHQISYVNPMQGIMDQVGIGKPMGDEFQGFEDRLMADDEDMPVKR